VERLGLGAAIGGHIMLLGAFALGLIMSPDPIKKQDSISVSLVGEIADVSSAPDAIQEESAPPAPAQAEPADPPPAPAPAMQMERPVEKVQPKPVVKPAKTAPTPPLRKTAAAKEPVKQPPAKAAAQPTKTTAAPSGKGSTSAKPGGLSKSFEDSISNIGKAPGAGKAVGTPAAKTAAEVRRTVTAALGPQIMRFVRSCSPNGVGVDKILTRVSLSLNRDGSLAGISGVSQDGVDESNRPQAKPTETCVLNSIRRASPFSGLDDDYYDVWKTHRMAFQPN
jgi:outer membrane biosynthesis protein TonB